MTDREALALIKRLTRLGDIRFVIPHAYESMAERNANEIDVINALTTAKSADYQSHNDRWRVDGGYDLEGYGLTVIVEIEDMVVVVTAF